MKLQPVRITGCPHRPTPKQFLALNFYGRELLYGGAAGGGKSDYLLMAALQYIHVPGYNAIIFRRTYPQLSAAESGLLARAMEWMGPDQRFHGSDMVNGQPTRWKFKGGGSLSFSHMQLERSKYDHQGPDYQFIGWDEGTQFLSSQYLYLLSRLRRPNDGTPLSRVPLRSRVASNPGGEGHEWVYSRFVASENARDNIFVPSLLDDNPHLDREGYRANLALLPSYERAQLEHGDWTVRPPGSYFDRHTFPIVDAAPDCDSVRFWDLAATEAKAGRDPDATAGVRMHRVAAGHYVISDVQHGRWSAAATEQRVLHTAEMDGRGVSVRMEQEPGASGKMMVGHFRKELEGFPFRGIPSTGSKYVRAKGFIAACERSEVSLVRSTWNEPFLRELECVTFTGTEHDDQADAAAGAWNCLTQRRGVTASQLYGDTEPTQVGV